MKKWSFIPVLSCLGLICFLVFSSCEKEVQEQFSLQMVNGSSADVHLWILGESIDPSNKLAPGASRTVSWNISKGEKTTFKVFAGQNGQTITTKTFEVTGLIAIVKYSGGSLSLQ